MAEKHPYEPEPCGDPFSGIGCPVPGCMHDDPNNPTVAEFIRDWNEAAQNAPEVPGA